MCVCGASYLEKRFCANTAVISLVCSKPCIKISLSYQFPDRLLVHSFQSCGRGVIQHLIQNDMIECVAYVLKEFECGFASLQIANMQCSGRANIELSNKTYNHTAWHGERTERDTAISLTILSGGTLQCFGWLVGWWGGHSAPCAGDSWPEPRRLS